MGKTKSVGKVQRMTRTQRAPREGQKQGKGRGPGTEPWRNTSEKGQKRRQGQRDPKERHSPCACAWPGLKQTAPTHQPV